jgi:voltage-gated potassium channel
MPLASWRRGVSAEPGSAETFPHERLIRRRAERAVARRRVLPFRILAITVLAVLTGVIARLIDRRDFHSIGDGVWWAIVTLGTVGYGDIVPHTTWGRVLGSIVIVCGVTFIAFLTATVTSLFVAVDQKEALEKIQGMGQESDDDTRTALRAIDERLAAIEATLDRMAGAAR